MSGSVYSMKVISIMVLLCSAASALEVLTCSMESVAAKTAVDHINEHHHHGYKFNLTGVEIYETDLNEELCVMKLRLNLTETVCHVTNPKPYEECDLRDITKVPVVANCNVELHVTDKEVSVNKSNCVTRQVKIDGCPDCPVLLNLTNEIGQLSVSKAVKAFNMNTDINHYYDLQEIGRIRAGYLFQEGTGYLAEFALVKVHCPRGSNCKPLCLNRADAFCTSTYTTLKGLVSVDCEIYPAENTAVLGRERECHRPHTRPVGPVVPPPHAGPVGPPPHTRPAGPPPHAGPAGPPPHAHGVHPPPCIGFEEYDPALHPICPWPVPEIPQDPPLSDS